MFRGYRRSKKGTSLLLDTNVISFRMSQLNESKVNKKKIYFCNFPPESFNCKNVRIEIKKYTLTVCLKTMLTFFRYNNNYKDSYFNCPRKKNTYIKQMYIY